MEIQLTPTEPAPAKTEVLLKEESPEKVLEVLAKPEADAKTDNSSNHTRSRTRNESLTPSQLKQRAANVVVHSRLKPSALAHDALSALEPAVTGTHTVNGEVYNLHDDLPLNRRGYKYRACRPNANFASNLYLTTDMPPFRVRACYFDRASGVSCSEDASAVTTSLGWLLARANVGMREGTHYFEFDVIHANEGSGKAHVRLGIGRKEAALEAPVGFDGYGYGLRDKTGQKITLSRPHAFMEAGFGTGDTIGIVVKLPLLADHRASNAAFAQSYQQSQPRKRKAAAMAVDSEERALSQPGNIVRDQIPIKYKSGLYFEQFEYTRTKQMDHLLNPVTVLGEKAVLEQEKDSKAPLPVIPNSQIVVYKNGELVGEMFNDLYSFLPLNISDDAQATESNTKQQQNQSYRNTDDLSLGYYPMMSVFQNGVVGINAGPDFKYAVPEGATPLCEQYDNQVTEEWLWDIIDEVEAEYLDSFD
ncbi:hypothetical protein PUMCH_001682 [Australozyma saopauloensis]|uniref:B30.2/SPRY domain-containing protein n=1 Tax=Australozyma saopauloensis TaxID=291208 RepID=A0AAX4H7E8_9ASCO|nr:hypothetical protein PUMCH_001682 [[Candida] saopauloensis]